MSIVAADEIASLSSSSSPLGWARTAGGPAAATIQAVRHNTGCPAQYRLSGEAEHSAGWRRGGGKVYYLNVSFASLAGSGGSAGGPNHVYQHHCSVILIIIIIVTISIIIILYSELAYGRAFATLQISLMSTQRP